MLSIISQQRNINQNHSRSNNYYNELQNAVKDVEQREPLHWYCEYDLVVTR